MPGRANPLDLDMLRVPGTHPVRGAGALRGPDAARGPHAARSPGAVVQALLREGLGAPPSAVRTAARAPAGGDAGEVEWVAVCALSHRCRIAPLLYRCLRASALAPPDGILEWFRAQYYETAARNLALQSELREVLRWLARVRVPVIVLKGQALASLGLGLARTSQDLDILVHVEDLTLVHGTLTGHGYQALPDHPHAFHRRYRRSTPSGLRVVEVHFALADRPRPYRPDLAGIWSRSQETAIFDAPARVPRLPDHLLLTIMQIPHHHWAMRLVVDVWQLVLRWGRDLAWTELLGRAASWRMDALVRSTLHALATMFEVPLPPEAAARSAPRRYVERVQWGIARAAIAEQLEHPFRPRMTWVAPYVMVDQPRDVAPIILRRTLGADGPGGEDRLHTTARRTTATVAALPALGRALLAGIVPPRTPPEEGAP